MGVVLQHDVFGVGVTLRSHDLRQYGDWPEFRQVWWLLFSLVWRGHFVFRKTDPFMSPTYVIHLSDMFAGSVPAFYREVYNIVCPNAEDHVDHDMFVNLLVKSSLPKHTLTQVNRSVFFDYIKLLPLWLNVTLFYWRCNLFYRPWFWTSVDGTISRACFCGGVNLKGAFQPVSLISETPNPRIAAIRGDLLISDTRFNRVTKYFIFPTVVNIQGEGLGNNTSRLLA